MKQLIAFPQLGNYFNPLRKLITNTTHLKVIEMPKITKETISLGSKNSPDTVCVPFKYNLGNFIEALNKGATVLFQAGGGCRYRYYAEVQETILKDLGYNFTMYQIMEKDHLRFNELYSTMLKLNPYLTRRKLIKEIISTVLYIYYLDKIDIYIRKRVGFEKNKNSFKKIKDDFIKKANKENSIIKLTRLYHKTKKELKKVEINKPKDTLKVGIIGELYTAMEPFATYELEKLLVSYNIEIKRFTNLSYLLWQKKLMTWFMKFKVRKYCKYTLGADGLDNVYRVYWLKKHKYDGIIHTKPTGCTPEIGAMPIIMNIAKDNNMPIIFLSFDEQTGVEGLNTRIEAFYDLLKIKKEEENGSKSRN